MINVTLPDGSKREFADGASPLDVAESISKSLAKKALAARVNGELRDLKRPLDGDSAVAIVTDKDADGLELIRHDAAHVLPQAVQELFPGTQVTIGPVIDDGFYYDFARKEPFSTDDFEKIEAKMREEALADAQELPSDSLSLVVFRDAWHEGVVGLVASRLKERHHRPVVAFAKSAADASLPFAMMK